MQERRKLPLNAALSVPAGPQMLLRCAQVACAAHVEVMRKCRPGLMEYALEAVFLKDCYLLGGCRHAPYTPICASGPNGAVLHYGHAAAPNGGRRSPTSTCKIFASFEVCSCGRGVSSASLVID